jgi:hypothetical protein
VLTIHDRLQKLSQNDFSKIDSFPQQFINRTALLLSGSASLLKARKETTNDAQVQQSKCTQKSPKDAM